MKVPRELVDVSLSERSPNGRLLNMQTNKEFQHGLWDQKTGIY